eukprot:TRINITY_DN33610_c0_g1_i1.p2 TRINITY_DN33610_c0_g1~~TRINITY_DN33610_c0_g1_i1.p2  ORF type:complete len:217 (+),score=44.72 TRINITY_DN33610_c0_g1_i1:101-751(+)
MAAVAALKVDHLVYCVPGPLEDAMSAFEERTGVRPVRGGTHAGLGTHNALVGLGDGMYLELLARDPAQPSPERTWMAIDSLGATPRLTCWAALRPQLEQAVTAARAVGYDPGEPKAFQRQKPDGSTLSWSLSYNHYQEPLPGGGAVPFLISWQSASPAESLPADCTLQDFYAEAPDPAAVAPLLDAAGVDAGFLRAGERHRLVATLQTPKGVVVLE